MQPIKVSFSLPQADLPRIQKRMATQGMTVTLTQQGASDGQPFRASVDFVGNQVNAQAGTIELRATFGNENGALVPGQLVDVAVVLDAIKGALVVPHDAVNLGPNTSFIYLVKQGRAEMVPVTVVHDDGKMAAIRGHVRAGDTVIVDGQLKVIPGGAVRVSAPPTKKT
jgi:multidrug efflux system membrane fusion protein